VDAIIFFKANIGCTLKNYDSRHNGFFFKKFLYNSSLVKNGTKRFGGVGLRHLLETCSMKNVYQAIGSILIFQRLYVLLNAF